MVINASIVLRGFFPYEAVAQAIIRAYAQEQIDLQAPTLLPYKVTNAVLQAVRRDRIDQAKRKEILTAFQDLGIRTVEVSWQRMLEQAGKCADGSTVPGASRA